ncbi:unnamed protein product [Gordionus sp. m RMFG-2023]
MTKETFYYILEHVKPILLTTSTNFIKYPISVEEKLMVCLRYLATGCRYPTLAYSFKMGISTIQKIVRTTCKAIWQTLVTQHMPPPTLTEFERIAKEFQIMWNLPNCIGSFDGKHCRIRKPPHSGSGFYNYKHFFSVVLQGIVDAKGKFITVDVGKLTMVTTSARSSLSSTLPAEDLLKRTMNAIDGTAPSTSGYQMLNQNNEAMDLWENQLLLP